MKSILASAAALTLVAAQVCAMPAYAEQTTQFRTATAEKFSSGDLQRYGLNKAAADRGAELQKQGYKVMMVSKEDAEKYKAGITDNQWILLGILAGVIVIAVAVAD
jgi:Flp pilus assembly protein TadB